MSPNEIKLEFEKSLQQHLTSALDAYKQIKVNKNEIKLKKTRDNAAEAVIGFDYLSNARGYVLYMSVSTPEFQDFIKEISPPYASSILTDNTLAMTSSGEKNKTFSPIIGGAVPLPVSVEKVEGTCQWIAEKILSIYLPRVLNLINFTPKLIDDVIANPDHYSYPFLLILYTLKKNNLKTDDVDSNLLFSKSVSKNKNFDKFAMESFLSTKD